MEQLIINIEPKKAQNFKVEEVRNDVQVKRYCIATFGNASATDLHDRSRSICVEAEYGEKRGLR